MPEFVWKYDLPANLVAKQKNSRRKAHGQFDPIVQFKSQIINWKSTLLFLHNDNDSLFFQCYFDLWEPFAFTVLFSCSRKKWHQKCELKNVDKITWKKKSFPFFSFFFFFFWMSSVLHNSTIFLDIFLRSLFCCETSSFLLSLASLFSYSNNRVFGKLLFLQNLLWTKST